MVPVAVNQYRHCTLIKLLWARVALFFVVCEHDLIMDALLEKGLSDIRCCYHSNIYQAGLMLYVLVQLKCFPKAAWSKPACIRFCKEGLSLLIISSNPSQFQQMKSDTLKLQLKHLKQMKCQE